MRIKRACVENYKYPRQLKASAITYEKEEIRDNNIKRSYHTIGFPVSTERKPCYGDTKAKMERPR